MANDKYSANGIIQNMLGLKFKNVDESFKNNLYQKIKTDWYTNSIKFYGTN